MKARHSREDPLKRAEGRPHGNDGTAIVSSEFAIADSIFLDLGIAGDRN